MIYTSYFAQLKNLSSNITPISICGKAPDWYDGKEYKALAPKWEFFQTWKMTHDNNYYIKCFKEQVLDPINFAQLTVDLQQRVPYEHKLKMQDWVGLDPNYHIALICYEKPQDFCHRHLVAEYLEEHGIKCKEWYKT